MWTDCTNVGVGGAVHSGSNGLRSRSSADNHDASDDLVDCQSGFRLPQAVRVSFLGRRPTRSAVRHPVLGTAKGDAGHLRPHWLTKTTQTYVLQCNGPGGTTSAGTTVQVFSTASAPAPRAPRALDSHGVSGERAVGNLVESDLDYYRRYKLCGIGAWSGAGNLGHPEYRCAERHSSFTLACAGGGGTVTRTATVTVTAGTPSVILSASPSGVPRNTNTTLSWTSASVASCAASGAWSGTKATSGSESVGPITQDTTYSLSCTGADGNADVATTTVSLREAVLSWARHRPRTTMGPHWRICRATRSTTGQRRRTTRRRSVFPALRRRRGRCRLVREPTISR